MTDANDNLNSRNRVKSALDTLATVAVIVVCIAMTWTLVRAKRGPSAAVTATPTAVPLPAAPVSLQGASLKGDRSAKLVLIEFSEFQCPFCAAFTQGAWPDLLKTYVEPGQLLVAFRHLPLVGIHSNAFKAAEAAECAGREGKFWEMHDALFSVQKQLHIDSLFERSATLSLDDARFRACMDGAAAGRIREDMALAEALSVTATPTFLLGTQTSDGHVEVKHRFAGAKSFAAFSELIDRELARTR